MCPIKKSLLSKGRAYLNEMKIKRMFFACFNMFCVPTRSFQYRNVDFFACFVPVVDGETSFILFF